MPHLFQLLQLRICACTVSICTPAEASLPLELTSSTGGNFATYPFVTAELFGAERSGVNYGVIFMVYGLTSATCVYVITFFLSSGPDALVYSLAVIQATGTLLAIALGALSKASPLKKRVASRIDGNNSYASTTRNLLAKDSVLSDDEKIYSETD